MAKKMTIRQIADQFGVSISTVSLALNDKPGVSSELRAKIKVAAKSAGYPVKSSPAVVHHQRLNTLGLLVKTEPDLLPRRTLFTRA